MIPIFYSPEMSAQADSYSPSAAKPRIVLDHWLAEELIKPEHVCGFSPASREDLALAHDREYVDAVLDCRAENGFGNRSPEVARSLPFTTGSMVAATEHVLKHGSFACSPTSGFHHATHHYGGGFCTFNGLAVAAIKAAKQGAKVGILDCDAHYGNGTDDILRRVPELGIKHHTFGEHFPCGERAREWQQWLFRSIIDLKSCDIVLYQAGADPFVDDPLGGQMTEFELGKRDRLVFHLLRNVVWNFAGGYTRDPDGGISRVVEIHTSTLKDAKFQQQAKASE